jgi:ribosomal protein S6--L-glutamate ligase
MCLLPLWHVRIWTMSVLVIGENDWPAADGLVCLSLADLDRRGLMVSRSGELYVHDADGNWHPMDKVIWRAQGTRDAARQHAALSLVAASSATCVNPSDSLFRYGTRHLSHGALRKAGLPIIGSCPVLGSNAISYFFTPEFPSVLKVGDWHMGYGKCRVIDSQAWNDAVDMAVIANEIVSIEPWIDYCRDLRILLIGDQVVAIERTRASHQWKANVCPEEIKRIDPPSALTQATRKAASLLEMEILGADWIEDRTGNWHLLEVNPAPGLQMDDLDCRPLVLNLLREGSR